LPAAQTTTPAQDGTVGRRDEILRLATDLFDRDGYANVGMRAIADTVGMRPASLYHHFQSKEEILYAICLRVTKQFTEETVNLLQDGSDHLTRMRAVIERQINFSWENRGAVEVSAREMRELAPEHLDEVLFHRTRYRRMLQSLIEDGVEADAFRAADPKLASLAILSMVNGVNEWFHAQSASDANSRDLLKINDVARSFADLITDNLLWGANRSS
jgi:AcrR family transcriptional regulator